MSRVSRFGMLGRIAMIIACWSSIVPVWGEPTAGSFPYAWRRRGAFAPQSMWFGYYPTRWRQWPGQDGESQLGDLVDAEEVPSTDDDTDQAPKPPESEDTLPVPDTSTPGDTSPTEPLIDQTLPPIEMPGPLDLDPTQMQTTPPFGDTLTPPLQPESTPAPADDSGAPPSAEPESTAPLLPPNSEEAPPVPLGEALPPTGESSPPAGESGPPPLESPTPSGDPGSLPEPAPAGSDEEPSPPMASLDTDHGLEGPALVSAQPNASVQIGWANSTPKPQAEPARFVPQAVARPVESAGRWKQSEKTGELVRQTSATRVTAPRRTTAPVVEPPRIATVPRRANPLRAAERSGDASTSNPLRGGR